MSTIQEKIDRLRRYKGDMKEAINGRHSTVPVDENMAWYSTGIWGIPEGGGGDDKDYSGNPMTTPLGYYAIFTASDGTVFVGAATDYYGNKYDTGFYVIKDGVATKFDVGYRKQYFFEASDGTVFIGDYQLHMYRNGELTELDNSNGYLTFFETSDGTTYCFNDSAAYAVKDGVGSFVRYDYMSGCVDKCFEASDGTLYIMSRYNGKYIQSIKNGVVTKIVFDLSVRSDVCSFFETSDGTICFFDQSRLYTIKDGVATEEATLASRDNDKTTFFEASDGTLYIGGFYASFFSFHPVTKIINMYSKQGMIYPSIFRELSDGTIVVGNSSGGGYLWSVKDGESMPHYFEGEYGDIYTLGGCLSMTPVDEGYMTHIYYMTDWAGVYCIDYNRETGEWSPMRQLLWDGTWNSVKIDENTGYLFCGSTNYNGIRGLTPNSSWLLLNTGAYNWQLYNDTFITTDRDHQYQWDDQLGLVERYIELPESPKCFITIAKQNTYDV